MERDKVVPLILEGYKEAANEAGSSVSGGIPSSALNSWYSKWVLWKILGGCVRVENARQLTRHTSDRRLCKALRHRKRTSPGLQLHTTQSCQTVSGQKIIWQNFCYLTLKYEVASNGIFWKDSFRSSELPRGENERVHSVAVELQLDRTLCVQLEGLPHHCLCSSGAHFKPSAWISSMLDWKCTLFDLFSRNYFAKRTIPLIPRTFSLFLY